MAIHINDKKLDESLNNVVFIIKRDLGIKNVSKTDAIRWLLGMSKQGKRTDKRWNPPKLY